VGFFPSNAPQYTCIVVIDEPTDPTGQQALYGGEAAAPVFREIADKIYASALKLHKPMSVQAMDLYGFARRPTVVRQPDLLHITQGLGWQHLIPKQADWLAIQANGNNSNVGWRNRTFDADRVPNLQGMNLRDALYLLENQNYRVTFSGRGRVVRQSLPAGVQVIRNKRIHLNLG
jgi:cell division protein FtsI (penicillin-binding protein 3)